MADFEALQARVKQRREGTSAPTSPPPSPPPSPPDIAGLGVGWAVTLILSGSVLAAAAGFLFGVRRAPDEGEQRVYC